jgi:hypothetical protein
MNGHKIVVWVRISNCAQQDEEFPLDWGIGII